MASSDLHLGLVKLGNSVPVQDLIKANANDDRRVQHLRQLLLSQLDLIQKQSEVIHSGKPTQILPVIKNSTQRHLSHFSKLQFQFLTIFRVFSPDFAEFNAIIFSPF